MQISALAYAGNEDGKFVPGMHCGLSYIGTLICGMARTFQGGYMPDDGTWAVGISFEDTNKPGTNSVEGLISHDRDTHLDNVAVCMQRAAARKSGAACYIGAVVTAGGDTREAIQALLAKGVEQAMKGAGRVMFIMVEDGPDCYGAPISMDQLPKLADGDIEVLGGVLVELAKRGPIISGIDGYPTPRIINPTPLQKAFALARTFSAPIPLF